MKGTLGTYAGRISEASYWQVSRTATYGFLSALPLLALYEVLIVVANQGARAEVRIGAEVWLKQLLALIGVTGVAVLGGLVLAIGVGVYFYERDRQIPLRPRYFGIMVAESAVYAVVVAMLVSGLVGAVFASALVAPGFGAFQVEAPFLHLALSIGAGLYEELFFRVLLVGGLYWLLRRALPSKLTAYVLAAVVGALLFSAVHYIGALGDAFTVSSFAFRFFFGLALNVIFLVRGFGIAAWTHALYDVMLVLI